MPELLLMLLTYLTFSVYFKN